MMKKLKIVSDGTPQGTKLLIDGVDAQLPVAEVNFVASGEGCSAILSIAVPEVELDIDMDKISWTITQFPKPKPKTPEFFGGEKGPERFFGPKDPP